MLNKNEYFLIALASLACVMALLVGQYLQSLIVLMLMFICLRRVEAVIPGMLVAAFLIFQGVVTGNAFLVLFVGFIAFVFYTQWTSAFKINGKVVLMHLTQENASVYAYMFLLFVGFDIIIGMISGASITTLLSPVFVANSMLSTLAFLSVILISRKIFDAAYFYLGYLVVYFGVVIYYSVIVFNKLPHITPGFIVQGLVPIVIIMIQIIMVTIFLHENK